MTEPLAGPTVTREDILRALREALEPLDYVYAMWEGGAAAFGRVDEWSDIDLQVDADDAHILDVARVAEEAMEKLSGIDLRYEIPQPTWHGHWQAFYRLKGASPYLLVDFVVMSHDNPHKFMESAIHGTPVVHFDKRGVVKSEPLNAAAFTAKLGERIAAIRAVADLFHVMTLKELNRGNAIEAMSYYHGHVLRPLVEALRITYAPTRYNFHTRYIYYELPQEVTERLEPFLFVASVDELRRRCGEAAEWIGKIVDAIDLEDVEAVVRSA